MDVLSAGDRPPRVLEVDGGAGMPSAVFAAADGRLVTGREAVRVGDYLVCGFNGIEDDEPVIGVARA